MNHAVVARDAAAHAAPDLVSAQAKADEHGEHISSGLIRAFIVTAQHLMHAIDLGHLPVVGPPSGLVAGAGIVIITPVKSVSA